MTERFIKFIPSEEAKYLLKYYPNAFLLLSLIAQNALRKKDEQSGLEIGDSILGNFKDAGLTRKEYRGAKDKLIEMGIIEIVFNAKKSKTQKRAIKRAIKSEVVCLIKSTIWDINAEDEGHQKGQLGANKGPTKASEEDPHSSPSPFSSPPSPGTPSPSPISSPPSLPPKNEKNNIARTAAQPRKKDSPKDFYFCFEEKKFIGIAETDYQAWDIAYEGVNIVQEIAKAGQWALANPNKRKKNWRKFLTNWLGKAAENLSNRKARIDQDKEFANEKEWEKRNREQFFKWKTAQPEIFKRMEYRNGWVINQKTHKEMSIKMHPDAFDALFQKIAEVKAHEA